MLIRTKSIPIQHTNPSILQGSNDISEGWLQFWGETAVSLCHLIQRLHLFPAATEQGTSHHTTSHDITHKSSPNATHVHSLLPERPHPSLPHPLIMIIMVILHSLLLDITPTPIKEHTHSKRFGAASVHIQPSIRSCQRDSHHSLNKTTPTLNVMMHT